MTPFIHITPYFSRVFWEFWLSSSRNRRSSAGEKKRRLHVYNVYDNQLDEIHQAPATKVPLFQGFYLDDQRNDSLSVTKDTALSLKLAHAEEVFSYLEEDVTVYLQSLLHQLSEPTAGSSSTTSSVFNADLRSVSVSLNQLVKLRRFLVFLRFRNSTGYASLVRKLNSDLECTNEDGKIYPAYRHIVVAMQRRYVMRAFTDFLEGNDRRADRHCHEEPPSSSPGDKFVGFFHEIMDTYCWRLLDAELCIGIVANERETGREEFILPESCYGSLEEGYDEDPDSCDFFFPINPSVSIYLLGTSVLEPPPPLLNPHTMTSIPVGSESMIDVHLRNSMILQTYPNHLIFSSLKCIVCSLKSYDEFRWINEHQDYSRLRMRCRQKYAKEELVKTLVLREHAGGGCADDEDGDREERDRREEERRTLRVFDLTDQVKLEGTWPVGFGSFSDVWKGRWKDPMEKRERAVAIKFLRSVMVQNVKERLIRRIQAEVSTWHQLCHRNVSQFFGIVQSASSFGMVSPWYSNGLICDFLRLRPNADRLRLLTQIASGVCHLHSHSPPIVHGDLKGGNILIDAHGYAIITDFGLSKVMEEVSQACTSAGNLQVGTDGYKGSNSSSGNRTSVFAGSTRWMAPELIMALVGDADDDSDDDDDDAEGDEGSGRCGGGGGGRAGPKITTMSDVYAFSSVCLEIATDQVPYPHRPNDHAVIIDIMRHNPPRRKNSPCKVEVRRIDEFWGLLDRCWAVLPERRPTMVEALRGLESMAPTFDSGVVKPVYVASSHRR